jgi:hypothetical protein
MTKKDILIKIRNESNVQIVSFFRAEEIFVRQLRINFKKFYRSVVMIPKRIK